MLKLLLISCRNDTIYCICDVLLHFGSGDCFCDTLWDSDEFNALCASFARWGGWKVKGSGRDDTDDEDSDRYIRTEVLSVTPID